MSEKLKPTIVDLQSPAPAGSIIAEIFSQFQAHDLAMLEIRVPPDNIGADYAIPLFTLTRQMNQAIPEIAEQIIQNNTSRTPELTTDRGFLNIKFERRGYSNLVLDSILNLGADYGKEKIGQEESILIDSSSPNIAKRLSIAHLRSTIIGDALANLYKNFGYDVTKVNHIGDWGTQFGKLIVAIKLWGMKDIFENPNPIKALEDLYIKFHQESQIEQEQYAEEIKSGQKVSLEQQARDAFHQLEEGDKTMTETWQQCVDVSLTEIQRTYDLLGISFDNQTGESHYRNLTTEAVDLLREANLLIESDGAQVVDLTNEDLGIALILKNDGSTLYLTRDIATAIHRVREKIGNVLYVVGGEQTLHFKQLFSIMGKLGFSIDSFQHVGFGMVKTGNQKLSTRKGRIVYLDDVIAEAIHKAAEKTKPNLPKSVSEIIGIGALKWEEFKQGRQRTIAFNWEKACSTSGDSAPYVQYAAVRAAKIIEKAHDEGIVFVSEKLNLENINFTDVEWELVKKLGEFNWSLREAIQKNELQSITKYLLNISKLFNAFYTSGNKIIDQNDIETSKFRLTLTAATRQIIDNGMAILGIEIPKEM